MVDFVHFLVAFGVVVCAALGFVALPFLVLLIGRLVDPMINRYMAWLRRLK